MPHPVSEFEHVHKSLINGGTSGVDTENLPRATHFELLAGRFAIPHVTSAPKCHGAVSGLGHS